MRSGSVSFEVLPRLASGCYVHFHDIYFPFDYQISLLDTVFFSNESILLHAFLIGNCRYSIAVSLSMLHHGRRQDLQELLSNYRPAATNYGLCKLSEGEHFPSSTYLAVS